MSQIHKKDVIQNRLIKIAHDLNEKNTDILIMMVKIIME